MTRAVACAAAIVCAIGGAAAADPLAAEDDSPFHDPASHVVPSLLVGVEAFRYHEDTGNPALQSRHSGNLPTTRIGVEATSPRATYYARAWFGATDGHMEYTGTDQTGNPLTGNATGYMTEAEAEVGVRWGIRDRLWLGAYVGLGHRTWRRDLEPITGGYLEDYSWSYVPTAFTADLRAAPHLTVSFEAVAMTPFGGKLRADFSDIDPTYSDLDIVLVNQIGGRLRLSGVYAATPAVRLIAAASLESTSVEQGPGTPFLVNDKQATDANGDPLFASEPYTYTTRYTLAVGAAVAF